MDASVGELIKLHGAGIAQLKEETNQYVGVDIGVPFDDLFILRFILSNKTDIKAASNKLKEALVWRSTNLEKLNQAATGKVPYKDTVQKHLQAEVCTWVGTDLLYVVRSGLGDTASLLQALSEEQVVEFLTFSNELNFRWVDAKTRETGVLCKVITLIDLYGFSMSKLSRKFSGTLAASSKHSNIVYPQLLRHMVFLNLPSVLRMMFNAFKVVMPKESVEKQRICHGLMSKISSTPTSSTTTSELIKLHSDSIALLKEQAKEYADVDIGVPFDDLFILRFILSSLKDLKQAGRKLMDTLAWRTANLDKLNQAAAGNLPNKTIVLQYLQAGICTWIGTDLVFAVRFGLGDSASLLQVLSEEQIVEFLTLSNEVNFRLVDARTRKLGVLCKVITVVDVHGFSMARLSRKFAGTLAASSKHSNTAYPQLLRHMVFLNLPSMLRVMYNAVKLLMPKESAEKQRICPGRPYNGQGAGSCPFLKARIAAGENVEDLLPSFLGGHAPVPESLANGGL